MIRPRSPLRNHGPAIAALALTSLLCAQSAVAQLQLASPGELPPINAKTQAAVIDSIASALNGGYVFADAAARMDSLLHANLAAGAYSTITDPADFMARLQTDITSIRLDRHMELGALPPGGPAPGAAPDDPFATERFCEQLRRNNYGFRKIEILPGNVGYLELTQFADTDLGGETAVGAMGVLANTDAVIIDLRANGGGSASMIQLLTGYFFEQRVHLIDWYHRRENETIQSWSDDYVPGKRMNDTPLYVLTSNFTGSAAEEFTYDLQNEKRATVVGERTGGAAHTVEYHAYDVGSFLAGIKLPSGRAISPVTKTNWEETGVEPDIAVSADKALTAAHLEALKTLEARAQDDAAKQAISWARVGLQSALEPYAVTTDALSEYVGTFGPRRFFMEGTNLMYEREGRPKKALVAMAKDLFGLEGIAYFRAQFTRDAAGAIDAVIGMYDDGRQERNPKTE